MSMNELKSGNTAIIKCISGDEKLAKRLLALGCIEGTQVKVKRTAPLGDPIVFSVRGFDLAIRKNDAENIKVDSVA